MTGYADHATYCPQHNPPPADGGGSSWLCCCSGPLYELRAAARALIDAEYGSEEAFDVLVDVVLEQERLVAAENLAAEVESLKKYVEGALNPYTPQSHRDALNELARLAAEDRAGEVAFRRGTGGRTRTGGKSMSDVPILDRAEELLWQAGHPLVAEQLHNEVTALIEQCDRLYRVLYPGPVDAKILAGDLDENSEPRRWSDPTYLGDGPWGP